jgi:hypothetical protein
MVLAPDRLFVDVTQRLASLASRADLLERTSGALLRHAAFRQLGGRWSH